MATQVMAEHRMYLPLAAVVTALILGGYVALVGLVRRGLLSRRMAGVVGGSVVAAAGLTLGILTVSAQRRLPDRNVDLARYGQEGTPAVRAPQQFWQRPASLRADR